MAYTDIMHLKPSHPIIELSIPIVLVVFFAKTILLSIETDDALIGFGSFLFLLFTFLTIYQINKNFKSVWIENSIKVKGYFWGQKEINIRDLKGYKLIEVRKTRHLIQDITLVLIDKTGEEKLKITQGDYKADSWDNLISLLKKKGIEFLGQESLAKQWKGDWDNFKERFLK